MNRYLRAAALAAAVLLAGRSAGAQPGSLEDLTGESSRATQLSGFGVVAFEGDTETDRTRFDARKLAVGLFRELHERAWIFGQLTTSLGSETEGGEASAEIEIDNLIVNLTPRTDVSVSIGKLDTPLGFERDDEPLNLQATTSYNFELARPPKMVGALARWSVARRVDVAGWVANGWEGDLEANRGKTVGGRLGVRPSDRASVGVGGLYGPEGSASEVRTRYLTTLDYAMQPDDRWLVAGEVNYGGDRASKTTTAAKWYGGTATIFRQVTRSFALAGRAERFTDRDGARTGIPQTVSSLTMSPVYFIGAGGEGIFANIEHTTFRIPRFQIRGDLRWDHSAPRSNADPSDDHPGTGDWPFTGVVQLVATF